MIEVFIRYSPYKIKSTIEIDGKVINRESKLYWFENEKLQVWLDRLAENLIEEVN